MGWKPAWPLRGALSTLRHEALGQCQRGRGRLESLPRLCFYPECQRSVEAAFHGEARIESVLNKPFKFPPTKIGAQVFRHQQLQTEVCSMVCFLEGIIQLTMPMASVIRMHSVRPFQVPPHQTFQQHATLLLR